MKLNFSKFFIGKYLLLTVVLSSWTLVGGAPNTNPKEYWPWYIITSSRQALIPTIGMVIIFYLVSINQDKLAATLMPRIKFSGILLNGYLTSVFLLLVYVLVHFIIIVGLFILKMSDLPTLFLIMVQFIHAGFLLATIILFQFTLQIKNREIYLVIALLSVLIYRFLISIPLIKEPYL